MTEQKTAPKLKDAISKLGPLLALALICIGLGIATKGNFFPRLMSSICCVRCRLSH